VFERAGKFARENRETWSNTCDFNARSTPHLDEDRNTTPSATNLASDCGCSVRQFMRGEASGSGVYTFAAHKGQYQGQWVGTTYEGYGTEQWAHGSSYVGLFRTGLRHGFGMCR
jgi:hypothetical protein